MFFCVKYLSAWKDKNDFVIRNLGDFFVKKKENRNLIRRNALIVVV